MGQVVTLIDVSRNKKEDDVLVRIKGEIVSMLEDKLEELYRESDKVRRTMEKSLSRIDAQGFETKLDDLKSGRWYKVKSEVATLQDVLAIFKTHKS